MASYIDRYATDEAEYEALKIPTEAVPGDAIKYSSYRDTETRFLGWNGELIENPDLSGSGYLTIPLEVTKHFKNAVKYYRNILRGDTISIVLRRSDEWVVKKYGRRLPKGWTVTYWVHEIDIGQIYIEFDDGRGENFDLFATYEEIKSYYDKLDEPRVRYSLYLNADDYKNWGRYEQSRDIKLPSSWKCTQNGSGGGRAYKATYEFYGPKSDRKAALAAIREYYDGYGEGIEYKLEKVEDSH